MWASARSTNRSGGEPHRARTDESRPDVARSMRVRSCPARSLLEPPPQRPTGSNLSASPTGVVLGDDSYGSMWTST